MLLKIILIFAIIYKYFCLKKYTIHSEGSNIITTTVKNQNECSSIAITQKGAYIKYKSDSSIISLIDNQFNDLSSETNSKYFMCQFSTNKIILIRGIKMSEIELDGNGNIINNNDMDLPVGTIIISLQCKYNNGYYVITYLTGSDKKYNFEIYSSSFIQERSFESEEIDSTFLSSSCFLVDNTHILCINSLSTIMKYYYHVLGTTTGVTKQETINLNLDGEYRIKGAIIKYYSNQEILMCINANTIHPRGDINLICYMININPINNNNINFQIKDKFEANQKVYNDINYCQIEKLSSSTSNIYASICLTFYYRTTYYLSIFKYKNNRFIKYEENEINDNYKNIEFSLLYISYISIIPFNDESFGIFFRNIDSDSMILMFYPKCGYVFSLAPKENECLNIETTISPTLDRYYFDECTHSFKEMPLNYEIFEKNQLCKIKHMVCNDNDGNDFFLDTNNNFGSYECWSKENPPQTYYFDNSASTFKKCFRTCLTCREEGNENNNKCISCKENFYRLEDMSTQCHYINEPLNQYFFDSNQLKFKKCRPECLTCNELGNSIDTKCTKCNINNDYWPQVDKPSNCIKKDANIRLYFPFNSYKSWEKCFEGCEYCTELGTSIYDTKCSLNSCMNGYTTVEDNNRNCFKKHIRYNYYFYDNSVDQFKKCDEACLQCDRKISGKTECLKCKESDNYYETDDDPSICLQYSSGVNNDGYFFDSNTKKFKKCQEGCLTCNEQINANENDTQCLTCDTVKDYYPLDNLNENCYYKNKKGYYLKDSKMYKCPEGCSSCIYDSSLTTTLKIKCKECDNNLKFYELEERDNDGHIINPIYKNCRTLRAEKILNDENNHPYNLPPPENTILSEHTFINDGISITIPMFKYCANACTKCTALYESELNTHCQAKQCNTGYTYILNYEDVCYSESKTLSYYYLYTETSSNKYFKPCYETCETCSHSGNKQNNNCDSCRIGYILHPNPITNPNNCVFDCLSTNNYFYLDEDNNDEYICVDKCPDKYPYLQPNSKQCLKSCRDETILKYSRDRVCVALCPSGTRSNNFEECVSVSNNCIKSELESNYILHDISNENINEFIINYCQDYSFTSQQITVIKNKLEEYKIFIYKNKDCINEFFGNNINFPDLSVCFDELKTINKINKRQDLIIMIMNIYNKHSSIRVEYKIFNSLTCEELNLNDCSHKNISTNINLNNYFSENQIQTAKKMYDKGIIVYDRSAPFFTDICYEYNTENNRDMILEDRVDQFYQDVTNICEDNCHTDADFDKKLLKCICELKSNFLEKKDEIDEEKYKFGVRAISLQVVKCAKKAFLWDYFKTNIGSYTALILIVTEIPIIVFFIKYGLSQVKIFLIPFMGSNPPKNSLIDKNEGVEDEDEKEIDIDSSNSNSKNINNENNDNYTNSKNEINEINNENKYSEIEDISNRDKTDLKGVLNNSKIDNSSRSSRKINAKNVKKKNYDIYKEIKDYDDINDIELFDAIIFDKRSFCQFYWDELKRTQPILYSFIIHTPLTPRYFKILLFIFNTIICFELNAFFYSKSYISNKFYNFHNNFSWYINNIYDRIILTCTCTVFLNLFIRVLTNSKKKMQMWIKREKDKEKFNKDIINMINKMYLNYIIFMSVQGVFMFFFWIYLSCFCNCYKNNEIEWFVTSLICFVITQLWYFISTFIVTCLRLIGIRFKMESCYNVSLCLAYD